MGAGKFAASLRQTALVRMYLKREAAKSANDAEQEEYFHRRLKSSVIRKDYRYWLKFSKDIFGRKVTPISFFEDHRSSKKRLVRTKGSIMGHCQVCGQMRKFPAWAWARKLKPTCEQCGTFFLPSKNAEKRDIRLKITDKFKKSTRTCGVCNCVLRSDHKKDIVCSAHRWILTEFFRKGIVVRRVIKVQRSKSDDAFVIHVIKKHCSASTPVVLTVGKSRVNDLRAYFSEEENA